MTTETLDEVLRRILNDPSIFGPLYDKEAKSPIPLLFNKEDWKLLKEAFERKDKEKFNNIVDSRCQALRQKEQNPKKWRKDKIRETIDLGNSLKKAYTEKPHILKQIFDKLNSFGIIECKLPNMEDYGKVIENHNFITVENYFLSKIDKEKNRLKRRALRKTLEYVKELYAMKLDVLEIAFLVRKLNSLTQFVEAIKDE